MKKELLFQSVFFLSLFLAFQSCRENDLPPPVSGDPVFFIHGDWDGNLFKVSAGDNDIDLVPAFGTDSLGVAFYSAEFLHRKADMVYPEALRFLIRSAVVGSDQAQSEIDLAPGNYSYRRLNPGTAPVQHFQFHSTISNGYPPFEYLWELDNGLVFTTSDPVIPYNPAAPFENVSLHVRDVFGKQSSYTTNFTLQGEPLQADFFTAPAMEDVVVNISVSGGVPPYQHNWNMTNNVADVFSMPAVSVLLDSMCLIVEDDGGNVAVVCKSLANPSSGTMFSSAFSYEAVDIPVDPDLSEITIEWTDENGMLYSSQWGDQHSESYFKITESQPYQQYQDVTPTQRLFIQYRCILYDADGNGKVMSGEGFIGVGKKS